MMSIRGLWRSSGGGAWGLAATALVVLATAARADEPGGARAGSGQAKPEYLDQMIRETWEGASIKPSAQATDGEFLRRVYLDALGRIPRLREAVGFLESKEPGKRAKLGEYL